MVEKQVTTGMVDKDHFQTQITVTYHLDDRVTDIVTAFGEAIVEATANDLALAHDNINRVHAAGAAYIDDVLAATPVERKTPTMADVPQELWEGLVGLWFDIDTPTGVVRDIFTGFNNNELFFAGVGNPEGPRFLPADEESLQKYVPLNNLDPAFNPIDGGPQ